MLPDSYKVEVLTYLNPHLIWIEVRDPSVPKNEFLFEQIGIYGVLPLDKTLDIDLEGLRSEKCDEWVPAAAVVIKDFLDKDGEVWFTPTHVGRRTSIFDDNVHKFGELTIKKDNGKFRTLTKHLLKSGFAYNDVCEFHEKLNNGKLKIKLSPNKTKNIIKELKKSYTRVDRPKNEWTKSIEKQTSIFKISQNLELSLQLTDFENEKNKVIMETLKNKFTDFELCKDVNEESVGRAYSKAKSPRSELSSDLPRSQLLMKKLSIKLNSLKTGDTYQSCNDSDTNSNVKELKLESSSTSLNTSSEIVVDVGNENKENILSRRLKYFKSMKTNVGSVLKGEKDFNIVEHVKNNVEEVHAPDNCNAEETKQTMKSCDRYEENLINTPKNYRGPARAQKRSDITRVAYGPPGLNQGRLRIHVTTYEDYEEQKKDLGKDEEKGEVASEKRDIMYGEVDSEVGFEIKENTIKDYCKDINNVGHTYNNKTGKVDQHTVNSDVKNKINNVMVQKEHTEIEYMGDLHDKSAENRDKLYNSAVEISSDNSVLCTEETTSLIKRKLRVYQNAKGLKKYNCKFSSSDTSNKDSSSEAENKTNKNSHEDESIEKVIEKLNLKYKDDIKKDDIPKREVADAIKMKNNVNPFKNIDPNISAFVDKLVTPVLMVHSKNDSRIQPVFEIRDVYFNKLIYSVLTNMSIERPMMLQSISWTAILRGYSLFMISPMSSGKTLGYLPAVCRLVSDFKSLNLVTGGPVCIIVCATAQSVANVERMAKMFLESKERVLACYAGVDSLHITTTLLNGCDLLISTPSSLVRLIQSTDFGVDLRNLTTFVLDDCERLTEVYADEIKLFIHQIKQMLNTRTDKDLKVQYIIASRIWCSFMENLAKKVPDTVICIGAFQECVLYSKANTSVSLVKKENKVDSVFDFLKYVNTTERTVIVCQSNEEVALLEKSLKRSKHAVFSCNNDMTIHDLYNLSVLWADYEEPVIGPILICCDSNLIHMNVTDAHNLIHYSMPPLFSLFCKRFAVLNDNYPSIFKEHNENVKIKVLLEETNVEQLPKILNFIKRCTDNIPRVLDEISSNVLAKKDSIKAKNYYPICDNLLTLGYCPDIFNCQERHTILKEYDSPKDWLPKEGTITCKILYYHSASVYSARLLSCTVDGSTTKYPQTHIKISMKMGTYYSKESNKKLHGIPVIGDVCATSIKQNFFVRCKVLKVLSRYESRNPNKVLVKLIDEERLEVTRDIYLYHLPEELKVIESQVVLVRLANIEPKDKDITFSDLARDRLKNITDSDTELFVTGTISLTLGNCIFVTTLDACQDLTSLNEVVLKYNLKQELLDKHAVPNPEHLLKLEKLCIECGLNIKQEKKAAEPRVPVKNLPKGTWAHLESDNVSSVFFASAINPDKFFVRLEKFESCMNALLQDIQKHVHANPTRCDNVKEGEIVLAKFPDDEIYERARIDCIKEDAAKCFFVDQGDWREIPLDHLKPITEQLINQLPFQAIECRLVGIEPVGTEWTDFSTYWFVDNCHNNSGNLKYLFVKYYKKEPAEFTNGHKYSVAVIDTNTEQDIYLNQLMIDMNLAQEKDSEVKYLDDLENRNQSVNTQNENCKELVEGYKDQENRNKKEESVDSSQSNIIFKAPLRSVPIVDSDIESDDSDKWDVNIGNDDLDLFPTLKDLKQLKDNTPPPPVSTVNTTKSGEKYDKPDDIIEKAKVIELDSDDLTSPDVTIMSDEHKPIFTSKDTKNKSIHTVISAEANVMQKPVLNFSSQLDQKRRPKLVWRQNKTSLTVKIQLLGVDNYELNIADRILDFHANVHDTDFAFELELYGVVDKENCSHENKGQYILVKLKKVLSKNWITLTRDGGIKKWIVYDVDNLDTSSDEETIDDSVRNIIKNIHDSVDTESEDEAAYDDAYIGYKK